MGTSNPFRIGERHGRLVVVGLESDRNVNRTRYIKCRCDCGHVGDFHRGAIRSGGSTQCRPCSDLGRRKVRPGEKYGDLTVVRIVSAEHRNTAWLCKCTCGTEVYQQPFELRKRKRPACRKCSMRRMRKGNIDQTIWTTLIRSAAEKRGLALEVDMPFVKQLLKKQKNLCALSGLPIHFATSSEEFFNGEHTASLDRIDSKLGYTKKNVQWVHKDINKIKVNLDEEYFIFLCRLVAEHNPEQ